MMEHSRASELLSEYARGDLDAETSGRLAAHLAGCEECSLELRAVTALLPAPAEETLTDLERARLHRAVREGALERTPEREGALERTIVPEPKRGPGRMASWLGAAAMLALVAVGITQLDLTGGDDAADGGGSSAVQEEAGSDVARDESAPVEFGGPDIGEGSTRSNSAEALAEDEAAGGAASDAARIPARFDPDAGAFKTNELRNYAAREDPFRAFAANYSSADAEALQDLYLDAIENAAPSGKGRSLIRRCALQVMEQDFPIVPAYGAYGRFEGRRVLVLGFVYAPEDQDLSRYLVWVWPRESCSSPVKIIAGRIVR